MKITQNVESCRKCPNVTNSAREHDDPFTSSPSRVVWWCKEKNGPEYIADENEIDTQCPLKKDRKSK